MSANIPTEIRDSLEKTLGVQEARKLVEALNASLLFMDQKIEDTLEKVKDKADFYITQKKFELKDELTKELATKEDLARLEGSLKGDIARLEGSLVRLEGDVASRFARLEGEVTSRFASLEGEVTSRFARLEGEVTSRFASLEGDITSRIVRLEGEGKTDIARLEGALQAFRQEIQTVKVTLDRKFTLMFAVLLFSIVFLNQNALEFLARILGLIR
ncbi:MAG: polymer-forming cytoskeletal protein [bacterium]